VTRWRIVILGQAFRSSKLLSATYRKQMVYTFDNYPNGIIESAIDTYIRTIADRNYEPKFWPTWVYDSIVRMDPNQPLSYIREQRFKCFVFFIRNGFSPSTAYQLCILATFFNGRPWPFPFLQNDFLVYLRQAQQKLTYFDDFPAFSIFLQELTQRTTDRSQYDLPIPRPEPGDYRRITQRRPHILVTGMWNNWMFDPQYPNTREDLFDYDEIDGYQTPNENE
jgi:hypothetical protein